MTQRILHTFADWKWTGPAEPVTNLCMALSKMGHRVALACGSPPPGHEEQSISHHASRRGVSVLDDWRMGKHLNLRNLLPSVNKMSRYLQENPVDVLHAHLQQDHLVAAWARRKSGHTAPLIRTNHHGTAMPGNLRTRFLTRHATDALLVDHAHIRAVDAKRFRLPTARVHVVPGAVDLERFSPTDASGKIPCDLGIRRRDIVIGVVARMQANRRFDILLQAFADSLRHIPHLKLLIVGKGEDRETAVEDPVRRMKIGHAVILAGLRREDYVDVLGSMDFAIYLVPGSDGTCRTVREFMAMRIPVIASRRGVLPFLVRDGVTGLSVEETPRSICKAIIRLSSDAAYRRHLGVQARKAALAQFDIHQQAATISEIYRDLTNPHPAISMV